MPISQKISKSGPSVSIDTIWIWSISMSYGSLRSFNLLPFIPYFGAPTIWLIAIMSLSG